MKTWAGDRSPLIGVRWDTPAQDSRIDRAHRSQLLDYVEVNLPLAPGHAPRFSAEIPILAHCPINPLASPCGVNMRLAEEVRAAAEAWNSPWIGEHLCWAGPGAEGRLGYIVTPILCEDFVEVAIRNVRSLVGFYGRPVALELGPVYQHVGNLPSEMHFLSAVASGAECQIILDVAHWSASNRNLSRPLDFGLDFLPKERVVELHIAGIRPSSAGRWWHDCHDVVPPDDLMDFAINLLRDLPKVRAITFEHSEGAPETDFMQTLARLKEAVCV